MGASRADWKSKRLSFWSVISYSMQQQQTVSWSDGDMQQKVNFIQLVMTSLVVGQRISSKALPKAKLAPKKVMVTVWWCAAVLIHNRFLNLGKNHYIWEVCSANQWDSLKTVMSVADIGQQNGFNSPWQPPISCCTTSASKVEWIELGSFASFNIFTWPLASWIPLLQASQQLFAGKMLPQ